MVTGDHDTLGTRSAYSLEESEYELFRIRIRCTAVENVTRHQEQINSLSFYEVTQLLENLAELAQARNTFPYSSRVPITRMHNSQ
jgi:hypothetical protein